MLGHDIEPTITRAGQGGPFLPNGAAMTSRRVHFVTTIVCLIRPHSQREGSKIISEFYADVVMLSFT